MRWTVLLLTLVAVAGCRTGRDYDAPEGPRYVGRVLVRVYSTHLGTMGDLAPAARRDQLRAILADAEKYPRVVIGGDMNDAAVGHVARASGYDWGCSPGAGIV